VAIFDVIWWRFWDEAEAWWGDFRELGKRSDLGVRFLFGPDVITFSMACWEGND
jgi:hypothetical protein